jgi:hypothetical protein
VKLAFGRVVIMPAVNAGTRLRVMIGDCRAVVTFVQADSAAALEATPFRIPGTDPETEPVHLAATLYATKGEILWSEAGSAQPIRLVTPARLPINEMAARTPIAEGDTPKWVASDTLSPLDVRGSATVELELGRADRAADLVLMELTDHRQKEVKRLAVRCDAYLGRFDAMVAALNNNDLKLEWSDYVDWLRAALARGPESAAAIRTALEKKPYPPQEADDLYRMLWGYSDQDLQSGQDAKLVKLLDHDTLAIRVLSFWNLKDITGLGLNYSPDLTAAKRQQSVRRWQDRLKTKEIRRPADAATKKAGPSSEPPPVSPQSGL